MVARTKEVSRVDQIISEAAERLSLEYDPTTGGWDVRGSGLVSGDDSLDWPEVAFCEVEVEPFCLGGPSVVEVTLERGDDPDDFDGEGWVCWEYKATEVHPA